MGFRRAELLSILTVFAATRLLLILIGVITLTFFTPVKGTEYHRLNASPAIDMWYRWDAGFYVAIARYGYGWSVNHQASADTVFLPLYPVEIHTVDQIVGCSTAECATVSGVLISNVALLAATILLYSLIKQYANPKLAWRCVWLVMLVPGGIFLSGVYAEPVFFCLTILCFYLLSKDHFVLAVGAAGLAALTRPMGVALYPALLVYLWQKYQFKIPWTKLLVAQMSLLTFGVYVLLVSINTHDTFGYFDAYRIAWQRDVVASPLGTFLVYFSGQRVSLWGWRLSWLDFGFTIFYIFLAILAVRQNLLWGTFALVAILIPISSGNLLGLPRYGMVVFPFYVLVAQWTEARWKRALIYSFSFILMILFTARFVLWHWLA